MGMSRVAPALLALLVAVLVCGARPVPASPAAHPHRTPVPMPTAPDAGDDGPDTGGLVLKKLLVINRHGHRAPNAPYWSYCPNDRRNRRRYDVDAEDLSGLGMQEEYELGQYLRRRYRRLIGERFNRTVHFFRAVGEPRILQSAVAVAQGIFPDGFGPGGFLPGRPQFVPVFSDMDTHEYLLDNVPCFRRAEQDVQHWINNSLDAFAASPDVAEVTAYMRKLCGESATPPPSFYAYIKTVADGMTFNSDLGLEVCKGRVTPKMLFRIRNLSLHLLMERLYHTDDQQTYTAVDLPYRFLRIMRHNRTAEGKLLNDFSNTRQTSTFYFVHREALYAFSQFFGIPFNVPGIPRGELPVASALIMEKLQPREQPKGEEKHEVTYVRFTLWTPYKGTSTVSIPRCRVPQLCRLEELEAIYKERTARTGTWDELCNYTFSELDHNTDIR